MAQRLASVEEKFEADRRANPPKGPFFIEFFRVIFGGWPVLGFVFLFLFYSPLRDALNAIPEKVKTASEIGALGVSLKSTVQNEAAKLGAGNLSETLPKLSGAAIELLLRAPRTFDSLMSYSAFNEPTEEPWVLELPDAWTIDALSELEAQNLIELEGCPSPRITTAEFRKQIDEFLKTHPGTEVPSFDYRRMKWRFNKPVSAEGGPCLLWQLSDLGKKAVEVILKAVSMELAPKPSPKHNP